MEESGVLITLAIVMLIGSYLAGSIPLFFRFSEDKLKRITVLGAGLLVGTALVVIIPEGVRALTVVTRDAVDPGGGTVEHNHSHEGGKGTEKSDPIGMIGISLVLGFVFMLVVDQISQSTGGGGEHGSERNVTATVGLVVHAAADGVALGAAATTSQADVELIVFLAIMLHKAPAAFGLVTFLLHAGLDRARIRRHLLVFSVAAPALALITFFGIGPEQKVQLSSMNGTGIAMLFSAGTFLYVATVHVLSEITQRHHHNHRGGHSYSKLASQQSSASLEVGAASVDFALQSASVGGGKLSAVDVLILVVGCLAPLVLTLAHHHH